jgi:hypothetical protein
MIAIAHSLADSVHVVSPKFQAQTSSTFTVAAEEDIGPSNVVYLSKVGKLLAEAEEAPRLKERNA